MHYNVYKEKVFKSFDKIKKIAILKAQKIYLLLVRSI